MNNELVILYQQMSDLTAPVCAKECVMPHSCCDAMYCELAEETAKEQGVTLTRTNHQTLPFMSETGCTVPPHLRQLCTMHVCCISSLGFKKGDQEWTEKYFELRQKIEVTEEAGEFERMMMKLTKKQKEKVLELLENWKKKKEAAEAGQRSVDSNEDSRTQDLAKEQTFDACINDVKKLCNL